MGMGLRMRLGVGVVGGSVNGLGRGVRGLVRRVRVHGYGGEDSLRCGVCGSMFRGARV